MHDEQLPSEEENTVREFLCFEMCFKALLRVHISFKVWFKQFHHRKPTPPEVLAQLTCLLKKALEEFKLAAEFTEVVDVIASEKQAFYE
ncbi:hypothetical protein HPB51_012152 [Rhipicephalus microplus]|uniref:Uncharacterized protein n=1 Tax=Rhipicephalus microplus TaxID=6941 RepID=A0A9J6DV12_RHIMP|nr:hypothetical protein HPB51_012152 [Rhipicephalus microplus]